MTAQLSVLGMSQLASWVGMEARTDGAVWVDNREVAFTPAPLPAADSMAIVVYDESGAQVARHEMAASDEPMSWLPVDADGVPLPAGAYAFALESIGAGGTVLESTYLSTYARIVEAMNVDGATRLVLEGGIAVDPSAISAIRRPAA
jgi:flagellar basal-body rod modification protein FlgD